MDLNKVHHMHVWNYHNETSLWNWYTLRKNPPWHKLFSGDISYGGWSHGVSDCWEGWEGWERVVAFVLSCQGKEGIRPHLWPAVQQFCPVAWALVYCLPFVFRTQSFLPSTQICICVWGCWNKCLQQPCPGWPKTTQMFCLITLEARSLK
jgi:hypothetical protein